jgi:arginase
VNTHFPSATAAWTIVSAPTNLGLRPPEAGSSPGTSKAPEALREAGLHGRLAARGVTDSGVVLPGRYRDDAALGEQLLRNHHAILDHSDRLALRLTEAWKSGRRPLVLGGDCSLLVGAGVAIRPRGGAGLIHIDGHTDFRHPGNSDGCASLAGEDLAAAVGLHWPAIANHRGYGPYFPASRTVHIGCRDTDENLAEARGLLAQVIPANEVREHGIAASATRTLAALGTAAPAGYWLHVDVDVLDASVFPAVDSPDPGGLTVDELVALLRWLVPGCIGIAFTVFDPDLDPTGRYAALLAGIIERAVFPADDADGVATTP